MIIKPLFKLHPFPGQKLRKFATEEAKKAASKINEESGEYDSEAPENPTSDLEDADLLTSEVDGAGTKMHKPVLDIDFGAQLIPSSTPGHYHLYLDKAMSWSNYKKLLSVLGQVGIVEEGYAQASINRGYSAVRLPWIKKPKPTETVDLDIDFQFLKD